MITEIKGWHVASGFVAAFGLIVAVNLTLAYQAVRTFPGLEVANSYVASQSFDADRSAQLALGWDVSATLKGDILALRILKDDQPIAPLIEAATFGRATSVQRDQIPDFTFNGDALVAKIKGIGDGGGNWNLRIKARNADGVLFQQRIVVQVLP